MASNKRLFEAELWNVKNIYSQDGYDDLVKVSVDTGNENTDLSLVDGEINEYFSSEHAFVSDIKILLWSDKIYGFEDMSFDGRTLRATVHSLRNPTTVLDCDSPLEHMLFTRNPPSTPYGNWDNRVEYDTVCGEWTIVGMVQDCSCAIRSGRKRQRMTGV